VVVRLWSYRKVESYWLACTK